MQQNFHHYRQVQKRTFLVVQWLRLHAPTAEGAGSIPGQGTKIPHAAGQKQQQQQKQTKKCNSYFYSFHQYDNPHK